MDILMFLATNDDLGTAFCCCGEDQGYHHTTSNATLPRNTNTRYPPSRHTIPNEHQWEEN